MKTKRNSYMHAWARLIGLSLIIVALLAACAPAATPTPTNTITGIVWQWTSVTEKSTSKTTTVPTPANYTIIFNTDGTLTARQIAIRLRASGRKRTALPSSWARPRWPTVVMLRSIYSTRSC